MDTTSPPSWAIEKATEAARRSWCAKDSRGVGRVGRAVVPGGAYGWVAAANGPPAPFKCGGQAECRAACGKLAGHAEERALWDWSMNGIRISPDMLHVRLENGAAAPGGPPSCIACSRTMLMAGARGVWLWLDAETVGFGAPAWRWYGAVEFHTLSLLHPKHNLPVIR